VLLILCAAAAGLASCSAFDFFGFEDNAPLHVVERPEGYPSVHFGAEIAATTARIGGAESDFAAVSAGRGYPTIFYRLASAGKLVDVEDPWSDYLADNKAQAQADGSGASLVGMSLWDLGGGQVVSGCVAIGEPLAAGEMGRVMIVCEEEDLQISILSSASGIVGDEQRRWFGHELAGIPPVGGQGWLLAVATRQSAVVFSNAVERSDPAVPSYGGADYPGDVIEVAAGRLDDQRFFVALTTSDGGDVSRIHLFTQDGPGSTALTQVACVDRDDAAGFGGSMVSGDLDRDGNDELIVSASATPGREEAVYVYEVSALEDAGPTCSGAAPDPVAELVAEDGPQKIKCGDGCDFGTALAVGDIATDDDGPELIVGAPGAKVDGVGGAGAVLVYRGRDLMADGTAEIAGQVTDSTPKGGQSFGGGVAVAPMAGRNELLIGVTNKGKLVIAFCTGVGENIQDGADVTSNASGTVVSTRCRPK
jgi:hypothetical protein